MNKKKIPNTPPLLVNKKLLSGFRKKAELFNRHFAEQCTLVQNTSTLPVFNFKTNNRLKSFDINENDLHLIIKNLNANKAHGWDDISIRMIQLCGKSIALPLKLFFKTILEEGTFPEHWKNSNVVPIHNKESKNLIKNYRPISLLPIFSKILERLIFNSMFNFFRQNNLFTKCQSGFIPGDSCVAQLLSITHEIYQSFDCSATRDVKGVFLNISKAFDKV